MSLCLSYITPHTQKKKHYFMYNKDQGFHVMSDVLIDTHLGPRPSCTVVTKANYRLSI